MDIALLVLGGLCVFVFLSHRDQSKFHKEIRKEIALLKEKNEQLWSEIYSKEVFEFEGEEDQVVFELDDMDNEVEKK